jgi:biopolymer transport protein TolQ
MALFLAGADWGVRLASLDVLDLIVQASWLVKLVLLLLGLASVISWAIIAMKWRELRRAAEDSEAFLDVYHEGSLEAAHEAARELPSSPIAQIFLEGYAELGRIARYAGRAPGGLGEAQLRAFERLVDWSANHETQRLERGLEFLATTGSAAPFVGLFGTVIGIINSFGNIGQSGSASLAVVAPGIAEALIATAVGLAAAIPATIFYNHFVGELRRLSVSIDLFSTEFQTDLRSRGARSPGEAARATGA